MSPPRAPQNPRPSRTVPPIAGQPLAYFSCAERTGTLHSRLNMSTCRIRPAKLALTLSLLLLCTCSSEDKRSIRTRAKIQARDSIPTAVSEALSPRTIHRRRLPDSTSRYIAGDNIAPQCEAPALHDPATISKLALCFVNTFRGELIPPSTSIDTQSFRPHSVTVGPAGITIIHMRQFVRSLPVKGGSFSLALKNGTIGQFAGHVFPRETLALGESVRIQDTATVRRKSRTLAAYKAC